MSDKTAASLRGNNEKPVFIFFSARRSLSSFARSPQKPAASYAGYQRGYPGHILVTYFSSVGENMPGKFEIKLSSKDEILHRFSFRFRWEF